MNDHAPRWSMRFETYERARHNLEEAARLFGERPLSVVEQAGLVQLFEIAWEQGWELMRDYLAEMGLGDGLTSPVATIRAAFAAELIVDGDGWMAATKLRNSLAHEYDEKRARAALGDIAGRYVDLFGALARRLRDEYDRSVQA